MKPELVALFKSIYNGLDKSDCSGQWCGDCPFVLLERSGCGVNIALKLLDGTYLGNMMKEAE